MTKTTVFHHSADWDGIFCREIANKFLGTDNVEYVGWDFKDKPVVIPEGLIYVMDLPVDRLFGKKFEGDKFSDREIESISDRIIWIDHHKSSIDSHPATIPGYRIDGVAACRLAWQWFAMPNAAAKHVAAKREGYTGYPFPQLQDFIDRTVSEPLAVRLAGEYDIFDKRMKTEPEIELFQLAMRSKILDEGDWSQLLSTGAVGLDIVEYLLPRGIPIQCARIHEYRDVITQQGFDLEFEGVKFLACNSHELDIRSHLFEAGIKPHHEALLGFTFNGVSKDWRVSMYRIPGKETDILSIAKKYGGGGHPGACGCRIASAERKFGLDLL